MSHIEVSQELRALEVAQSKDRESARKMTVGSDDWKAVKHEMYRRRKKLHALNRALVRSYR